MPCRIQQRRGQPTGLLTLNKVRTSGAKGFAYQTCMHVDGLTDGLVEPCSHARHLTVYEYCPAGGSWRGRCDCWEAVKRSYGWACVRCIVKSRGST